MAFYALELGMGIPLTYKLGYKDPYYVGAQVLGLFAAMWRMGPWPAWVPRNKYLVWAGTFALFQKVIRPIMEDQDPLLVNRMITMADIMVVSTLSYLAYRQMQQSAVGKPMPEKAKRDNSSSISGRLPRLTRITTE